MNTDILDTFAIVDFLSEYDIYYYPFIIDSTQLFLRYLKHKYDDGLVVEAYTPDSETISNIEEAIQTGQILVIKDFDQELLNLVMPIVEWKNIHLNKMTLYYMMNQK